MNESIRFQLNGRPVSLDADADRKLLWVLRTDLGLTGAKYGCGAALCGACTVLVDGEAVRSCTYRLGDLEGRAVTTIEGLAADGSLHPLQAAFVEHDALQCGFCTPGMILTACSLLAGAARPSREEIIDAMDDNLCRCGGYQRIVRAIEAIAEGGRP
ncbi:MAG: (2Fe-2S)-binding protein [Planctomycetota bacterium]|jgi:aerobic-type carbon monoxide dehydrogenase small subunit (CoxS/CutS family)